MVIREEQTEIYGAKTLYRECGYYQLRNEQYDRCLRAFDKAVEITPDDRRTLLGRSRARAKTLDFGGAHRDVDHALQLFPKDLTLKQCKANVTYLSLNFEEAIVRNIRGLKLRTKPDDFHIGALQCTETTECCIGKRAGHPLRDYSAIIRTIAWKRALDLRKGFHYVSKFRKRKKKKKVDVPLLYMSLKKPTTQPRPSSITALPSILESLTSVADNDVTLIMPKRKTTYKPLQRLTTNIDNMLAEKYLEKMCFDKIFLGKLRTDRRLPCANKEGTKKIVQLAKNNFKSLSYRQELLRTRMPFYSIKYKEVKATGNYLKRQMEELEKRRTLARQVVETFIADLTLARDKRRTVECIDITEKAKVYIDKTELKVLPRKFDYLKTIYELVGSAHLDKYRWKPNASDWDNKKRIHFLFGLPISRPNSADSVIKRCSGGRNIDLNQAIRVSEERMKRAKFSLEMVWLFYELARFNIDLRKFDLGRVYARKCMNIAYQSQDYIWTVNASFIIAKAHVMQKKRNEAKTELYKTKEYATKLEDEYILEFIDKCIEMVESIDIMEVKTSKIIEERKSRILNVISPRCKSDVRHLLTTMSAIPARRRMSIIPGVKETESLGFVGLPTIQPRSSVDYGAMRKVMKTLDLPTLLTTI